jgi:hypothetical protein
VSNTKQIEEDGLKVLRRHLIERLGVSESDIEDTRNKGRTTGQLGCDLVLHHDGSEYFIEMKTFSREVQTNIRFAHQTVASFHEEGLLHQLLVALVSNLEAGAECAKVQFFRFGDVSAKDILVEPHFIIQRKQLSQLLHTNVNDLLTSRGESLELNALLSTQVRDWMRRRKKP